MQASGTKSSGMGQVPRIVDFGCFIKVDSKKVTDEMVDALSE